MSWKGLKDAVSKVGSQVRGTKIDDTTDLDFEYDEKRYRAMETVTTRLEKELRHYRDSLRMLTNAQESMTSVLSGFYGEDETTIAHAYYEAMKEVSERSLQELEEPYLKTVLNPVERFNSYYVNVNDAIKKRARKRSNYDSLRVKLKKLENTRTEDPGHDLRVSDVRSDVQLAQMKYDHLNGQLKDELPKLITMRVPYLNPSFESFVKIQLRFFHENFHKLNELQQRLDPQTRQNYVDGSLEKNMDNILDKVKELNITV